MPVLRPLLVLLVLSGSAFADEPVKKLKLEIELIDGSRVFAEPVEASPSIGLRSRVGQADVPLCDLAHFEVQADQETVAVQWPNGDRLTGVASTGRIHVHSVLGKLEIPLASIRRCTVQVITADRPLKPAGVSASGIWGQHRPANAIDGERTSSWNSGGYTGWVELDLGADYELALIRAEIQFSPSGHAVHGFYVSQEPMRGNVSGGRLVKAFSGTRKTGDMLAADCEPGTVGRYVQFRCTNSVAWFNVREVEVLPRL